MTLCTSSRSPQGVYESLSLWDLKNGPDTYADVAVSGEDFQFDATGKVKRFDLENIIRNQVRKYDYAPQFHYFVEFKDVADTSLKGQMMVYRDGQPAIEAGTIVFQSK